jgi:hypothetical protein
MHYKYGELRQNLLAKKQLPAKEMTGDSIGKMLKEVKKGVQMPIPFALSRSQMENTTMDIR